MKKGEKLPIDLVSYYDKKDRDLAVVSESQAMPQTRSSSGSGNDNIHRGDSVIEMGHVVGDLSESQVLALKKRYLKLNAKQKKLIDYTSLMLRYYEALISRIQALELKKDLLFTKELIPVSKEISDMIAHQTFFSNAGSLTEFSQSLRGLVKISLESLSQSYSSLEIINNMSNIQETCGESSQEFTNIRNQLLNYQSDKLPCVGNRVDYTSLSHQSLSDFAAFLEDKLNEVCINVSKFTLTFLCFTNSNFSNSLDQLNSLVSTLEKKFQNDDFSRFKSRYVSLAARYLSQGRPASATPTKIVENSRSISLVVNLLTLLSPHRFIDPHFDVTDQDAVNNAEELLSYAACDTIETGGNCPVM